MWQNFGHGEMLTVNVSNFSPEKVVKFVSWFDDVSNLSSNNGMWHCDLDWQLLYIRPRWKISMRLNVPCFPDLAEAVRCYQCLALRNSDPCGDDNFSATNTAPDDCSHCVKVKVQGNGKQWDLHLGVYFNLPMGGRPGASIGSIASVTCDGGPFVNQQSLALS